MVRPGRTTIIHFGSQVVLSVTGFVATFAIAYLLNADGLGLYAVAAAMGHFWLVIPAEAVGSAITKRMSEREAPGAFMFAGYLLNVIVGITLAMSIYVIGSFLPDFVPVNNVFFQVLTEYRLQIALLVISSVAFRTSLAVLDGAKMVAVEGAVQASERLIRTCLQIGLMLGGFGVSGLLLGQTASMALTGIVGAVLHDVTLERPTRRHIYRVLSYARYSWLGSLKSRVFGWMDTLVLSFFVGSSLIGIYEAAWGLASLLAMVSASIRRTLFPELSELATSGNRERVHHFLNEGLAFGGIFVIPGLFGAAIIGERVLRFYRPSFGKGALILLILVGAYVIEVYGSQFVSVINAVDRPDVAFRVNIVFVTVNLVLNVALVYEFGWYGAAAATAITSLVWAGLALYSLGKIIGPPDIPLSPIAMQVAASFIMTGVVYVVEPLVPSTRLWTLALVGLGAGVYVITLIAISKRIRNKAQSLLPAIITVNFG